MYHSRNRQHFNYILFIKSSIVFILWGKYAQGKKKFIPAEKHFILEGVHPSPLSAHRGFFGSKPFSQANHYLEKQGFKAIQWQVDI